jgi:hypothetical protein
MLFQGTKKYAARRNSLNLPPANQSFMNRLAILPLFILGIISGHLSAQNALLQSLSPRSHALGKSGLNFTDINSLWTNQAGLARLEELTLIGQVEQRFLLAELNQVAAGGVLPTFSGVFGLNLRSFGTADYRETGAGLAYARKLSDRLRIGGQLHWSQISISEYGSRSLFNLDFGLQAELLPKLWAAAHVRNAIRQQIFEREYTPGLFSAGLFYTAGDKVQIFVDLVKDIDFPADLRVGIEYNPAKAIFLRIGSSTAPGTWSFGFGLPVLNHFTFDFAAAHHPYLGFTPSAGLIYRKKK